MFAALLPAVAVPTAGAAAVPPIPSPATVLSVSPFNGTMSTELRGAVCQSPNTCTPVVYVPFFDATGVAALQDALTTTSAGKIIVFGYSDGAAVAEAWLVQHLNDPNAPSPEVLSFVVFGNSTRAFGGFDALNSGVVWPQSGYQVIDVAQQYDGVADWPDNTASPYYLMAVINAELGSLSKPHLDYTQVDINDPANAVWTVGNITYVLTPTPNLPMLLGFAPLFPSFAAQLQAQIETAYTRPVPFPTTTQPASPAISPASALSTSVVSDPTVAPQQTTVPVSLAPVPTPATTDAASTATGPMKTNRLDTAAAATTATPTVPDAGNVVRTVKTTTAPAAKPSLDTTSAATPSTTTATNHTSATSSTNGNTTQTVKTNATRGKVASTTARPSKAR